MDVISIILLLSKFINFTQILNVPCPKQLITILKGCLLIGIIQWNSVD